MRGATLAALALLATSTSGAAAQSSDSARALTAWLEVPAGWRRSIENGVVAVQPDDLASGQSLVLLIDPLAATSTGLAESYEQALRDLGPGRPVESPREQQLANGWAFRHGVGVATLDGRSFTAHTAVALRSGRQIRIWVLANSDETYNRYQTPILNAIASVQDIAPDGVVASAPAGAANPVPTGEPPPGFGEGVSGVYTGIERGASASAGVAPGGGPAPASYVGDYAEVDVLFPDGTYRRRLPLRGLATDLGWERRQQPVLWGRWTRDGNRITVERGSYRTSYTIDGETLVSDRGRAWVKVPVRRDVRLDGTYVRADFRDPEAPRLVLRPDGSYEDRGGFLRMVGSAWHLVAPDGDVLVSRWTDAQARQIMGGGSGTYRYDAFTLTLRDRDGRVWQINALVPPDESLPNPRRLYIHGRALVRE
ncbi:MAG: hypothetical protein R2909_11715 [Gemmatimonadales bacterium]